MPTDHSGTGGAGQQRLRQPGTRAITSVMDAFAEERVAIPTGITVAVAKDSMQVSGPKGTVQRQFVPKRVAISVEGQTVVIRACIFGRHGKALVMSMASHVANMFVGVQTPYQYKLKICSGHFPMTVKADGRQVKVTNFLGEKIPRTAAILESVKVTIQGDAIVVESVDLEAAGQTAANLERATRIVNRDRRVFQDGIYIIEKPA